MERRRLIALLMAAAATAGCAVTPEPRTNPWLALDPPPAAPAAEPVELPAWPRVEFVDVDGRELAAFDLEGFRALERIRVAAEGNTAIAGAHADQVGALHRQNAALIDAGAAEHELAEIRGQLLAEERRARLWDRLQHWAVLALLGVAAAR